MGAYAMEEELCMDFEAIEECAAVERCEMKKIEVSKGSFFSRMFGGLSCRSKEVTDEADARCASSPRVRRASPDARRSSACMGAAVPSMPAPAPTKAASTYNTYCEDLISTEQVARMYERKKASKMF